MSGAVRRFSPTELAELRAYDAKIDAGRHVPQIVSGDAPQGRSYREYNRWYYALHREELQERARSYAREHGDDIRAKLRERELAYAPYVAANPLRIWRAKHGLNISQAASRLGCSNQSITNWEHGRFPIPQRISRAIGGT